MKSVTVKPGAAVFTCLAAAGALQGEPPLRGRGAAFSVFPPNGWGVEYIW